jgi:hypothetical protein
LVIVASMLVSDSDGGNGNPVRRALTAAEEKLDVVREKLDVTRKLKAQTLPTGITRLSDRRPIRA